MKGTHHEGEEVVRAGQRSLVAHGRVHLLLLHLLLLQPMAGQLLFSSSYTHLIPTMYHMLEICFEGGLNVNNDLKKNVVYGSSNTY
jgi:hypothetical protein